jgi:1-acyl-sn-glycerol-3-phosphate acyltransferase
MREGRVSTLTSMFTTSTIFFSATFLLLQSYNGIRFGAHNFNITYFVLLFLGMISGLLFLHPYRGLGIYAWLGTAILFEGVHEYFFGEAIYGNWLLISFSLGVAIIAEINYLRRTFFRMAQSKAHPKSWLTTIFQLVLLIGPLLLLDPRSFDLFMKKKALLLVCFGLLYFIGAWYFFSRAALELFSMPVLEFMYKMRTSGPGVRSFPSQGPVIVIANHAAIFDPPIIEHQLPRPVTGFMTSTYFDHWLMYPLAKWIFKAIRVHDSQAREEAPELKQFVKALDRGECVLIFPEGWLRRKEEIPLRRFGQGIWHVLTERPDTPIVACWIEGTWGSFFSHKNGPLGKNKWFDFRRRIQVGVSKPFCVPKEVLEDRMNTRLFLMDKVSMSREHLGLEPLANFAPEPLQANA